MADTSSAQIGAKGDSFPVSPPEALSVERLAHLQPQLHALLAGLRELDAIVPPDTEPAFTPRDCFEEGDDAR